MFAHRLPKGRPAATILLGVIAAATLTPVAGGRARASDLKVYSPVVEKGEFALEARGNVAVDDAEAIDGALNQRFEIEYTPTNFWHTALIGEVEKEPGEDIEYEATAWENIFQIFPQGRHWLDLGLYVEYEFAAEAGKADALEWKVLAEKNVGPLTFTINPTFEKEIGSEAEESVEFKYAARVKWRLMPQLEPAIEVYGDIGEISDVEALREQRHQIGPVLLGKVHLGRRLAVRYELGYLFGLTRDGSPDGAVKWLAELEYHF